MGATGSGGMVGSAPDQVPLLIHLPGGSGWISMLRRSNVPKGALADCSNEQAEASEAAGGNAVTLQTTL